VIQPQGATEHIKGLYLESLLIRREFREDNSIDEARRVEFRAETGPATSRSKRVRRRLSWLET
jgi:hypothetical protein